MSPGLRLAGAWLARAAAWGLIAYGVLMLAVGVMVAVRQTPATRTIHPGVPLFVGVGFASLGWYIGRRARAEVRRQAAARRDRPPRGFEVVGVGEPVRPPEPRAETGDRREGGTE